MNKNSVGILLVALGLLFSCVDHNTPSSKVQFIADTTSIRDFLEKNGIEATKTEDGVWYAFDKEGLSIYPVTSDSIEIEYSICDIKDTTSILYSIDSVGLTKQKTRYKLLSNLIAGLQIGLQRFPVGSQGRIYVPSGLAFGTTGNTDAKVNYGNENLLFRVKVVSVKGNRFATDTTAIVKYIGTISNSLYANKRVLIKDPSGIRYWYDSLSSSTTYPNLTDHSNIDITYSTRVLNAALTFDSLTVTDMDLTKQITAWKLILPKIPEGSTVTMCVPSGYAYGSALHPADNPKLEANSSLVYVVKLIQVH